MQSTKRAQCDAFSRTKSRAGGRRVNAAAMWRNRTLEFGESITVRDNLMEARINTFIGILNVLEVVLAPN